MGFWGEDKPGKPWSRVVAGSALVLAGISGGCIHSTAVQCPDGTICPGGTACDPVHQLCVTEDQGAACDGQARGADCAYGGLTGKCDEVCVPNDVDLDGAIDDRDNCPNAPNESQLDSDLDGYGDECDLCPNRANAFEHDEDGDGRGDTCDLCPTVADFGLDTDGDGVANDCDPVEAMNRPTHLVAFDPFLQPGDWVGGTTPWAVGGDVARPLGPLAAGDGLTNPRLALPTTGQWQAELGYQFTRPIVAGDRVGIAVGQDVSCSIECATSATTMCLLKLLIPFQQHSLLQPVPALGTLRLVVNDGNPGSQLVQCYIAGNFIQSLIYGTTPHPGGTLSLVATPGVVLRNFAEQDTP